MYKISINFKKILTLMIVAILLVFMPIQTGKAANLSAGTAEELIAAINIANGNSEGDVITLTANITLFAPDNTTGGANGLPSVASVITIEGAGFTIERNPNYTTCENNDHNPIQDFRILHVGSTGELSLNDVTIKNGCANDTSIDWDNQGGGIRVQSGKITLINQTVFTGNMATSKGAGIHIKDGSITTISNSTFSDNFAKNSGAGIYIINSPVTTIHKSIFSNGSTQYDDGGGIYLESGTIATISDSTFSNNSIGGDGSGIFNRTGTITKIINCTFSNNFADYDGGGIYNQETITEISNSTFYENEANDGAGIYNTDIITNINKSIFTGNEASDEGGAIKNNSATIGTIIDSTFSGNSANYRGGAIDNGGQIGSISNSVFSGNSTPKNGGAIYNKKTITAITNVTLTNNSATLAGGGIYNSSFNSSEGDDPATITTINNVTITDNSAGEGGGIYGNSPEGEGVITTMSNTIIANNPSGGNCTGTAPTTPIKNITDSSGCWGWANTELVVATHLGALADNGGPTKTLSLIETDPANPTIDTGDNASCESTDQRGVTRPQGADCDIGAYETGASILTVTNTTPSIGALLTSVTNIDVIFSESPIIDNSSKSATYIDNYLLVKRSNPTFETQSCSGGLQSGDVKQTIASIVYNATSDTATLNLASALTDGIYRLFICGTTSIWSSAGLELNNGVNDTTVDFTIGSPETSPLPASGFPLGHITSLPTQPVTKDYSETAMVLEIPSINTSMPIVGVPLTENNWDVTWLGNSAGYLAGSSFPTWAGNTVLTGHAWDANNNSGPFANLKDLKYGDLFFIHAFGQTYTYQVRSQSLLLPNQTEKVFQHEEIDWVTLLTCELYNPLSGEYIFRRMVRAVLVNVK